jgi:hypothetical protein
MDPVNSLVSLITFHFLLFLPLLFILPRFFFFVLFFLHNLFYSIGVARKVVRSETEMNKPEVLELCVTATP